MEASTSSAHAKRALITYYAPNNRVFDRVFKDQTLEQTRAEVRQKLNLPPEAEFRLAQLRDNMKVDLEDEDDFEAFRTQAHSSSSLHVEVSIEGEAGGSTYVALQRMSSAAVTSGVMTISGRGMKKRKRHPNGFERPNGQISTTSQFTPQAYLPQQAVIFPAPAYGHDSATPVPVEKSKSKKRKRRNSLEDQLPLPSQSIRGRSSGAMRPDLRVDGSPRMSSPPRKKKRAESLAPLPIPTSQERPSIDSTADSSGGIVPHRASKKHNHRDVSNSEELLGASGVSAPPLNSRAKEVLASSAKSKKKRRLEDIETTDVPMQSPPPPSTPSDETPALVQTKKKKKKKVRKSVESPNVPPSEEIQASLDDNLASTPSFTQPSSAIRAPVHAESSAKQKKKSKVPDTIPLASTDAILTRGVSEEVTGAAGTTVSQERPRKKRSKTDAVTQPTEVVPSDANPDNVEILTEGQKKRRRKMDATQLELSVSDHATHPLTLSTPTIGHRRRQTETQAESKPKQKKPKLIASSMEAANDDPFTITLVHTPHARPITAQKVPVAPKEKEKKSDLNVSSGPVASSTTLAADIANPDEDAAVDIRQKAKKSSKTRRGNNADMHVESGDVQPEEQTRTKRNSKKTKDKESTAQKVRTTPSVLGSSSDVVEKGLDLAQPSQFAAPKGKSTRKRKVDDAREGGDEAPKAAKGERVKKGSAVKTALTTADFMAAVSAVLHRNKHSTSEEIDMAQTDNAAPVNIPSLLSTDSAQDADSPPNNVPDTVVPRNGEAVNVDRINGDFTVSRSAVTKERSRKSKPTKPSGHSESTEEIVTADSAATKEIPPVIPDSGLVDLATTRMDPKTKPTTKKGHKLKDGQCPVCRAVPLHLRFRCPVVEGGVRSIEAWLQESQEGSHDESLIREMRLHLEKAKRKVSKADERNPDNNNRSASQVPRTANLAALQLSSALNQSFARELSPEIPFPSAHSLVPAGSEFSEVVVEDQGEGSESDDDTDEDLPIGAGASSSSSFPLPVTFDEASVEALLRGPTHSRSVLAEVASDSSTEEEFEAEELASVEEERNDRAFRRLTKRFERFVPSSDDEPEPDADEAEAPVLLDVHHQGTDDQQEQLPESHVANEGTQPNADVLSIPEVDETVEQRHSDTPQQHIRQHQDNDIDASTPVSAPVPVRSKRPIESAEEVIPSSDPAEVDQDIAMDESMQDNSSTIGLAGENTVFATSPIVEPMILPPLDALSSIQDVSVSDAQVTSTVEPHSPKLQSGDHFEDQLEDQPSDTALRSPEDPEDPIESADDFVAPVPEPSQEEQDPIEPELTQRTVREERSTPPPLATPRPGTAKRMKDRNGKVPRPDELPVLASEILHAVQKAKAASVESDLGAQVELLDDPNSTSASLLEPDTELERPLRRSVRRGASEVASSQTPSLLDPVTGRKRRQTMTAEEKAQKAAEKLADKERKAALKKAEKEEKVRRKAEDKARMEAEKKAQKALKGVDKTARGKKGEASLDGTALPVTTLEPPTSFEPPAPPATIESEVPPVTPAATSARLLTSQNGQVSQVHWTILNHTPDAMEGDSMIDELHSSSPVPSPNHDNAQVNGASQESSRADDSFFTPTGKTNGISPAASTPLFLPSSQYPDTQPALQVLASQVSPARSDRSVPASEPESDHDDAVFKKPSQPASVAHHWTSNARFRRLSDIASQQLFAPTPVSSTPLTFQTEEDRRKSMYGDMGDIDSSDDSDTDSDDEGNKSHIPKARRAGVQKRKSIT